MRCEIVPWARASTISFSMRVSPARAGRTAASAAPQASRRKTSRRLAIEPCIESYMAAFCHRIASGCTDAGKRLIPHHDQAIDPGFRAPNLTGAPVELAHVGAPLVAREAVEPLG